jgi:hypothetical protein
MKGKRHRAINHPCYAVEIEDLRSDEDCEPVVLAVIECEALLRVKSQRQLPRVARVGFNFLAILVPVAGAHHVVGNAALF